MKLTLTTALLLLSCTAALCADADMPLTRVTLYTSGVGYFERTGTVDGSASMTLAFPTDQINDVLKSLILLDQGGGTIRPVTYAAIDPVAKQLKAFSVDVSDNPDRAELLNRMRGTKVTVTVRGPQGAPDVVIAGVIMGTESRDIVVGGSQGSTTKITFLSLLADDGMRTIPLDDVLAVRIDDVKLDQELRQALKIVSQGRDDSRRSVTLGFDGKGKRPVLVAYVAATPVWQTSYRLLLGKAPLLQGWGIVQNTTDEDWNNVSLTLVSGRPVSFIEDLYTPLYIDRPTVQSQVAQALNPVVNEGDINEAQADRRRLRSDFVAGNAMPMSAALAAPAAMPAAKGRFMGGGNGGSIERDAADIRNETLAARGARLGEALFTYSIPVGVTIPRQQSAMIPFLSCAIEAQKVGIYNESVNALHPMSGARIKNTTGMHLLGGPITVFEDAGGASYAGDAIVDDTQPGQSRLISYALDVPVSVVGTWGPSTGHYLGFRIVKGVLETLSRTEQERDYKIKNNGETDQTIVVEQRKSGDGWNLVEPLKPTEETTSLYRFDVSAPSGKASELKIRQARQDWLSVAITSANTDTLLVYTRDGAIGADVRAALQEAIKRRQAVADAQKRLDDIGAQLEQLSDGQGRIRENMKVLSQTSTLYKRYADELDAQETKIAELIAKREDAKSERDSLQSLLDDYLRNLNVGEMP